MKTDMLDIYSDYLIAQSHQATAMVFRPSLKPLDGTKNRRGTYYPTTLSKKSHIQLKICLSVGMFSMQKAGV